VCLNADDAPALLNQRICAFYPIGTWDARPYLFVYFRAPAFRDYVDTLDTGTLIKHMHSKQVLSHELILPPEDEAEEICSRVTSLLSAAERIERAHGDVEERLARLPRATLAKAFRGELVPQDTSDEPASVLLARLRSEREAGPAPSRRRARTCA
jgi:type I restriction enzyme S subunit